MNKLSDIGILLSLLFVAPNGAGAVKNISPNILLIVSEDTSLDLGCYGNTVVHTPNLDRLAENGVKFSNAYTTSSVCSPSRAAIFTGLYPYQNGQFGWATHYYTLYDGIKVLPQYLKEAGYRTGIIGKIHVNPETRFNFDFGAINDGNFGKQNLEEYAANAKKFIKEGNEKPYFLMVNFPDTHLPHQNDVEGRPKIKVDKRKIKNTLPFVGVNSARLWDETEKYYNCVNRLDESVGMLLDSIGDLSNTCIIYAGDHGAQFSRGKMTIYEGGLKVPFIMQWKEKIKTKNTTRNELVSFIDILPTILEISGAKIPEELPGKSIVKLFDKNFTPSEWRQYLGAENTGASPVLYYPQRSIRSSRYKLIHTIDVGRKGFPIANSYANPDFATGTHKDEIEASVPQIQNAYKIWDNPPEWELYDLKNDPWEFKNLAENPDCKEILKQMQNAMMEWLKQTNDPFLDKAKLGKYTHEMDSINRLYPNHSYQKVKDFKWKYLGYLDPKKKDLSTQNRTENVTVINELATILESKFICMEPGKYLGDGSVYGANANYHPTIEKRVIESDRYLAWATLSKTRNGELIVAFSGDRDTHVCPWGKTQIIRSVDHGKTWSGPETINNTPLDDRDAGIIQTSKGTLLISWFTSVAFASPIYKTAYERYARYSEKITPDVKEKWLGNWVRRSEDNGKTWDDPVRTRVTSPHGPIQLKDGRLLYFGIGELQGKRAVQVEQSADDGRSWELLSTIEETIDYKGLSEPHVVELSNGKLLALVRNEPRDRTQCFLLQTESADGGKTWTPLHSTGIWGYPPHLIELKNGWLLVVYGYRKEPFSERACISRDQGKTWDVANQITLKNALGPDMGYPSSVQLEDGSILTVYYQAEELGKPTSIMSTHWRLKEDK